MGRRSSQRIRNQGLKQRINIPDCGFSTPSRKHLYGALENLFRILTFQPSDTVHELIRGSLGLNTGSCDG